MSQKTFSLTAGVVFTLVALGHVLRVVLAVEWTMQGQTFPMWPSWGAAVVAAYLASQGFRLSKKSQ